MLDNAYIHHNIHMKACDLDFLRSLEIVRRLLMATMRWCMVPRCLLCSLFSVIFILSMIHSYRCSCNMLVHHPCTTHAPRTRSFVFTELHRRCKQVGRHSTDLWPWINSWARDRGGQRLVELWPRARAASGWALDREGPGWGRGR